MAAPDERSFVELLASLARDIPELLRKEIDLARSEARRALELLTTALGRLALGSVVAVGAVGLALATLVSLLTTWLISRGIEPQTAGTIATGVVTLAAAVIAGLLFWSAIRALRAAKASLEGSVSTLTESATNVMEKF